VTRVLAKVACVAGAIAALGLAYLAVWDLYLTGFPDSHLTDYDKAVETPKRVLMWVEVAFAPLFLVLAFSPIGTSIQMAFPSPPFSMPMPPHIFERFTSPSIWRNRENISHFAEVDEALKRDERKLSAV
jgi:hypothetical protein